MSRSVKESYDLTLVTMYWNHVAEFYRWMLNIPGATERITIFENDVNSREKAWKPPRRLLAAAAKRFEDHWKECGKQLMWKLYFRPDLL